ncbi:hypothetical protein ACFYNO_04900 [Kitasatospora sp. NPDC006697]|uniref:hypothetical protein n=1 Tax=Kitasatospora sp. NPDC006697 TaxID=3364020 RepID=UPI003673AABE
MRVIHEMKQVGRLASGAQEWACPACGRRVALAGPPEPAVTVLDPGDETAVHIGLTTPGTAVRNPGEPYGLGPVQQIPRPPNLPMLPADPPDTEAADRAWLAEIGIDWDGDAAA